MVLGLNEILHLSEDQILIKDSADKVFRTELFL